MEKEAKFSILIKPNDMSNFLFYQTYKGLSGWIGILISVVALVILATSYGNNDPLKNIMLALIGALFTIIQPIQLKMQSAQQVKINPAFKEPLEYMIDANGIKVKQNEEEVMVPWDGIRNVKETSKAIFVYTNPKAAFILPKEQYKDQYEIVKGLIKENLKDAQCKWKKA